MCWVVGITAVVILIVWAVFQSGKAVRAGSAAADKQRRLTQVQPARQPSRSAIPTARKAERPPAHTMGLAWFGPGTTLDIGGFRIANPCTYASSGDASARLWATDPSELLLQAPARPPRGPIGQIGYWPWYSRLLPEQRHEYLAWLATGKLLLPKAEGFLFLYFYGLERRVLIDARDREWIVREVIRLRELSDARPNPAEGTSFRRYSTALLWFVLAREPDGFDERAFAKLVALTKDWTFELLTVAAMWLARRGRPLPPELAMQVARVNARAVRSVITERLGREFAELFNKRYADRFGRGVVLGTTGTREHVHRTASGGIGSVSCTITDPWTPTQVLVSLIDLWNSCVADLRPLSRQGQSSKENTTVEGWEALPAELRKGVDHPLQAAVQRVIADAGQDGQEILVPIGRLAALLAIEQRPKLTPTQSRKLAETAEHTGYSVEPDYRLTARVYEWNERVAIYLRDDDTPVDAARYRAAACMLRLGLNVALADGSASEAELRVLGEQVDRAFQCPPAEQRRLEALRALLLRHGSDPAYAAKIIERGLSNESRRSIGQLLVAIAAASDGIDQAEVAALRKCFRALGLGADVLDQTLSGAVQDHDQTMVSVQAAGNTTHKGEMIPPRAAAHTRLVLDQEAINVIMSETQDVARMLAEAMRTDGDDASATILAPSETLSKDRVAVVPVEPSPAIGASGAVPGPDTPCLAPRYQPFYDRLLSAPTWTRGDAEAAARTHNLMLSGAIEAINDWAFERYGTPMIEDEGETLSLNHALL